MDPSTLAPAPPSTERGSGVAFLPPPKPPMLLFLLLLSIVSTCFVTGYVSESNWFPSVLVGVLKPSPALDLVGT